MLTFNLSYTSLNKCMELRETSIPFKMPIALTSIMVRDKAIPSWTVDELACPNDDYASPLCYMFHPHRLGLPCSHTVILIMDTPMLNPGQPSRTVPIVSQFPVIQNEICNNPTQINQSMAFVLM